MKNGCISILLILLYVPIVHAQEPKTEFSTKIDSLQQLLNLTPKDDSNKVIGLNNLARLCFFDFQYKRGVIATRQAQLLAQQLNYKQGEGLFLRTMAFFAGSTSLFFYYNTQTNWYYDSIHQSEPLPYSIISAQKVFNPNFSTIYVEKNNAALIEAIHYLETVKDKELMAVAYLLMSSGKFFIKDNEWLNQSLQLFKASNQRIPAFYVLNLKKRRLETIGKAAEAKAVEEEINKVPMQSQDLKEKAFLFFYSGFLGNPNKGSTSIEYLLKTNLLLESIDEKHLRIITLFRLGLYFGIHGMYRKAIEYYQKADILIEETEDYFIADGVYGNLAYNNIKLNRFKEAEIALKKSFEADRKLGKNNKFRNYDAKGQILMRQGKYEEAIIYFQQANRFYKEENQTEQDNPYMNLYLGQCYQKTENWKESIQYGEKAYTGSLTYGQQILTIETCILLSDVYEKAGNPQKAFDYLKKYRAIMKENDEQDLLGRSTAAEIEGIIQKSDQEKANLEKEKLLKENENQNQRWLLLSIAGVLFSTIVLLAVLYRNNKNKQKANALLHRQKEEIDLQRNNVERTLSELKSTQIQLIQKEKLASLGELTAGIAHEIQNPLNFVNNFSEVSTELVDELKEGPFQQLPDAEKEYAEEILSDLTKNLQKITHHGGRASSIVKGMLEHSRTGTGERTPTDLNKLADEYLRLSYHGMRAKDKNSSTGHFNADFELLADPDLPLVNVVPQEIGRVLLNLLNNAFYAVGERAKKEPETYHPMVKVIIKHTADMVNIQVQDNGGGIPESVKAKIFQPFFTTKPTGEGTGLGLSLSYDIITKGHGGVIEAESMEGEETTFIIKLPTQTL